MAGLLAFLVLFVLGMPVSFAILIPSIAYIWWEGIPMATVAQRTLYALDSTKAQPWRQRHSPRGAWPGRK